MVIERLKVEDANATAGFTYGAVPPTAFLGMAHALSRGLDKAGIGTLDGAALVCHDTEIHAYRAHSGAEYRFTQKRHPLKKDGSLPTIVEQGRMRVEVSLVIEANLNDDCGSSDLKDWVEENLGRMRLAGGVIERWARVRAAAVAGDHDKQQRQQRGILRRLLPGYALIERSDLLIERYRQQSGEAPNATMVDAWADFAELHAYPDQQKEPGQSVDWTYQRIEQARQGWIVPILAGYRGLESPADNIAGARAPDTPVTFCEPAHTIAEWRSPHRFQSLDQVLWHYEHTPGWYLARNHNGLVQTAHSTQTVSSETRSTIEE